MNVQELFRAVSWKEVAPYLIENYEVRKQSLPKYKKVFEKISGCEPAPNNDRTVVCVRLIKDGDESWYDVYGCEPGRSESLGLEFCTFAEWAGFDVDEESMQTMLFPELVAHMLWEMTWMGFNDEDILAQKKTIAEELEEVTGRKQITTA